MPAMHLRHSAWRDRAVSFALAAVVAACASAAAHAAWQTADRHGETIFETRVVNQEGQPLVGARAWAAPLTATSEGWSPRWVRGVTPLSAIANGISGSSGPSVQEVKALSGVLRSTTDVAGRVRLAADFDSSTPVPVYWLVVIEADDRMAFVTFLDPDLPTRPDLAELRLARGSSITGRVVDAEEQPIAGACVRVRPWDQLAAAAACLPFGSLPTQARSDAEGRFVLRNAHPGSRLIDVAAAGFVPATVAIDADLSSMLDVGSVALARGETLSGRVVDVQGHPVAGAVVMSSRKPMRSIGVCPEFSLAEGLDVGVAHALIRDLQDTVFTRTDDAGRFVLRGLVTHPSRNDGGLIGERVDVVAMSPGFDPACLLDTEPDAGPVPSDALLELPAQASLLVSVVDADTGERIEGAGVIAERSLWPGGPMLGALHVDSAARPAGTFLVRGAGRLETIVNVTAPGRGDVCAAAAGVQPGAAGNLEIRMPREAVLSVRVTATDGTPLRGMHVTILQNDPVSWETAIDRSRDTDAEGLWRADRLPPGSHSLTVSGDDGRATWSDTHLVLAAGEQRHVDVALPRGANLDVSISDPAGRPAANSYVELKPEGPMNAFRRSNTADARGHVRFVVLWPGRYTLTSTLAEPVEVEVAEGAVIRAALQLRGTPTLRGTVTRDTLPLAAIAVQAWRLDAADGEHAVFSNSAFTDVNGRFAIELPTRGRWSVRTMAQSTSRSIYGLEAWSAPVDLDWEAEGEVTVEWPTQRWDVLVEDDCNRLRPATDLLVVDASGRRRGILLTDAEGHLALDGLEPGDYDVCLGPSSQALGLEGFATLQLVWPEARQTTTAPAHLVLPAGAGVWGVVAPRDAGGSWRVRAIAIDEPLSDAERSDSPPHASRVVDGRYVVAGLRPGSYRIVAEKGFHSGSPAGLGGLAWLIHAEQILELGEREERRIDFAP